MKNLKLGVKLAIGFGAVLLIMVILGGLAIVQMSTTSAKSTMLATENVPEVDIMSDVQNGIQMVRLHIRTFGLTGDPETLKQGREELKKLYENIAKAEDLANKSQNLDKMKESIKVVRAKTKEYEGYIDQTEKTDTAIDKIRPEQDAAMKVFIENSDAFQKYQYESMEKEFVPTVTDDKRKERLNKINLSESLAKNAYEVRLANFRSQVLNDPSILTKAMPLIENIEKNIGTLKPITTQDINLKQLGAMLESVRTYKEKCLAIAKCREELAALATKRNAASDEAYKALEDCLNASIDKTKEISKIAASNLQDGTKIMIGGLIAALALGFVLVWVISGMITRPIIQGVAFAQTIASGDLTTQLDIHQKDEIGQLADALNSMSANLRQIMRNMSQYSTTLSSSSEELSATSNQMASGAEEMTAQASTVAAASEQMSANINNFAAAAEEMSSTVHTVATAIEEMSASLSEVAKNCAQSSRISNQADAQARSAGETMQSLSSSATEIGKVLETINDIADQTNLLALNATIEAASAGEAGKGFAVVANEVKELAKQTAQATDEIASQIEKVRTSAQNAVVAIESIGKVISEVNSISQTIASAVEEQSATTNEIARSVGGASQAANEIARNVQESSKGATEISSNIQGVSTAASETATSAAHTNVAAVELSKLASRLQETVQQFKIGEQRDGERHDQSK